MRINDMITHEKYSLDILTTSLHFFYMNIREQERRICILMLEITGYNEALTFYGPL